MKSKEVEELMDRISELEKEESEENFDVEIYIITQIHMEKQATEMFDSMGRFWRITWPMAFWK